MVPTAIYSVDGTAKEGKESSYIYSNVTMLTWYPQGKNTYFWRNKEANAVAIEAW